jgi:hypothetical protein
MDVRGVYVDQYGNDIFSDIDEADYESHVESGDLRDERSNWYD